MTDREQFDSRVAPVMDRVKEELRSKQADELRRYMRSPAYILAGGVGPDGGMGAQAVALDSLNVTGEWNSKTVEDYVGMVKDELRREHIDVTPACSGRSRSAERSSTTPPPWRRASAGA